MAGIFDYMRFYCVCAGAEIYLSMRTRTGIEATSFPVLVYNVNSVALSQANNKDEFISIWNSDASNQAIGVLSGLLGPFSFKLTVNPGATIPSYVIGEAEGSDLNLLIDYNGDILTDFNGDYLLFQ